MADPLSPEDLAIMLSPMQKELLAILKNGALTRDELVKNIDKPRTTIYDNLQGLINFSLVKKYSKPLNKRGRPLVWFAIRT